VSGVRRAIEFLTTRALRSRLGIAVVLAVFILGIVGAARFVSGGSGAEPGPASGLDRPIATVNPTAGDDGVASAEAVPSPSTRPGAPAPDAVGRAFADAWLIHRDVSADQWHAALVPYSTADLAEKLVGVDPAGVPAERLTGEPVVVPQTESLVEVTIPVDTGRLRLQLVGPDGRWLVDGVDWERS
jgi:hypothetical protein